MEPTDDVQKKAGRTMAFALRRPFGVIEVDKAKDMSVQESERSFPVITARQVPLTLDEASGLLDDILAEHSLTMTALAK